MQEGVSAEGLVAKLGVEPSQDGLRELLELAKAHHGALPVASFYPLLQSLTTSLLCPETSLLSAQIILELIPDSNPEFESNFPAVLASLFERLAADQSDVVEAVTLAIKTYSEYTKNLEQVFSAAMQFGLKASKVRRRQWQGRMRTLLLVEPLMQADPAYAANPKNLQRLVETLVLMARDTSVRVQTQAKSVVLALSTAVPEFEKVISSLSAGAANVYESEIAQRAPRLTQDFKLLRSSLQSQPQAISEEASTGYAYQTAAATDRVKSTLYESQLAPNGLEFGFVPPHVMTQLREAENWRSRAHAVQELESLVSSSSDDLDSISPFLSAFFRFLRELLCDTNLKVTQSTLNIVTTLLTLPGLSKRANVAQLIPSCLDKLGDNKIAVRQAAFKVFRGFIAEIAPRLLFPHLLSALSSANWHIREAVLHVMMAAMLCDNPDYDYDFCALILPVAGLLDDQKPKVAFTSTETLAVIAHVKGRGTVLSALEGQLDESRLERLQRRFEQGTLPLLKEDYIEFPKAQPTSAPLISNTQAYSPEDTRLSASPIARQKDVNSSNSTEDTSLSPGFRFGAATDTKPFKPEDGDLPALRQPYLPINMSTKGGGSGRRVSYGYQVRSSLNRRHPLLRFNLAKPTNDSASEYFPSPAPTRRKAADSVSVSENSLYAPLEQLDPVSNPEAEFQHCLVYSQSQEWSQQFEMLNTLRRLLRHHVSVFPLTGDLHTLILAVVKLADSLRSSLSKNSLIVIKEMAEGLGKGLDPDLEVVCMLVTRKCGDTNVFISEEAEHALLAICQHCSENRVIFALLGQSTIAKVSIVKAKISFGLQHVLRRCAQSSVRIKDLDRLFVVLAGYLSDASSDVRSAARSAFSVLRVTFHSESDFEKVLFRSLPDKTAKEVKSSIADPKPLLRPLRSQSSRRNSSPFKPPRAQRKVQFESSEEQSALAICSRGMGANEWKARYDALDQLAEYVKANSDMLRKSPLIMTVVDLLTQACGDKNLSVSLHALDSLRKAAPLLAGCLEPHLPLLLRALSSAMAAGSSAIRDAASESASILFQYCDPAYSASALSTAIPTTSAKAKPVLTSLVSGNCHADMLPKLKPGVVRRHVLPLAYKLMDDPKPEVREECFKLLQALYREVGSLVVESAPSGKLQKVLDLINE